VSVAEPHALLAARDEDGVALRARPEVARRLPRVLVGADAAVRGDLGFVMVRRDERRAGVAAEMGDLRIDDERNTLGCRLRAFGASASLAVAQRAKAGGPAQKKK
jgi:hypothetical protein